VVPNVSQDRRELGGGSFPEFALAAREIKAYSDLLLHDLGGAEGDLCMPQADPGEYRRALWGFRYQDLLLHDGERVYGAGSH
jgi:CxxC motif-containing protein (DUF1111 family)